MDRATCDPPGNGRRAGRVFAADRYCGLVLAAEGAGCVPVFG